MIIPDINLLIYAYNCDAAKHARARQWLEDLLSSDEPVGIPWVVVGGFLRLMTHPSVLVVPLGIAQAVSHVRDWLGQANVQILEPGPKHLLLLEQALIEAGVGGNLVTDAQIAALALEYQATIHSNDSDFARFPGLRWHNPLES